MFVGSKQDFIEVDVTPVYNFLKIAQYEYNIMTYGCKSNINLINEYVAESGLPETFDEAAPIFNELIVRELVASQVRRTNEKV